MTLQELIELLAASPAPDGLWEADAPDPGWGRLYGGQVLAQALYAAEQTVVPDRTVHSLHGYFLRPGRPGVPVRLEVDRIRDGRSFTTRRVVAWQESEAILNLSASFHGVELGLDHADAMPQAPGPDGLPSQQVLSRTVLDRLPPALREQMRKDAPFEIRPIDPYDPTNPVPMAPHRQTWFKATSALPDDPALHKRLLTWAADSHFFTTATQPHGVTWLNPKIQMASLDHAMWFHRPFRADEWLLYDVHSATVSGSRGLVQGRFWTRDGQLVATTTQEGLLRDRR